jgi:hypothetical protein
VVKAVLRDGAGRTLDVAVKSVDLGDPKAARAMAKELTVLNDLRHTNIVRLLGACKESPLKMLVVLELCQLGSLRCLLGVFSSEVSKEDAHEHAMELIPCLGGNALGLTGEALVAEVRKRLAERLGGGLCEGANAAFIKVASQISEAVTYLHKQVSVEFIFLHPVCFIDGSFCHVFFFVCCRLLLDPLSLFFSPCFFWDMFCCFWIVIVISGRHAGTNPWRLEA